MATSSVTVSLVGAIDGVPVGFEVVGAAVVGVDEEGDAVGSGIGALLGRGTGT